MNRRHLALRGRYVLLLFLIIGTVSAPGPFLPWVSSATSAVSISRGPYIQKLSPSAVTFRWRTSSPTTSVVRMGTTSTSLNIVQTNTRSVKDHVIKVGKLKPRTKYFYSIGSTQQTLVRGTQYFVRMAPRPDAAPPMRFWALGDAGTGNYYARAVRDAYYKFTGARYTDAILLLGDNAYKYGTDSEYQKSFFDIYNAKLRQSPVWSTIGNHDTAFSTNPDPDIPYFRIFDFPKFGELGGMGSGTEDYYSFNYGNVHFVSLDSATNNVAIGSPMYTWLKNDMANNTKRWTVAFFHHPPYSKGSHNSDTEWRLKRMREYALPILENYGVDLVLSGHSHSYERSYLIDGVYGTSGTVRSSSFKSRSSGRIDQSGAYVKSSGGHKGAVYIVAGSAGKVHSGSLNHPVMFSSLRNLGSVVIDVNQNRMDVRFVRDNRTIGDYFTILKD